MKYCDDETKNRFLKKMLRGDEIWSLLFSEPIGGSDLAGLRTRAVQDADDWVINGQKVWTSFAQYADLGVLVARSPMLLREAHRVLERLRCILLAPRIDCTPVPNQGFQPPKRSLAIT